MVELGSRRSTERVRVGNSPPKAARAALLSRPLMRCRNIRGGVKTGVLGDLQDKSRGDLFTVWSASGIEMA